MSALPRPGKVLPITSHSNPRIKSIRALTQAKFRKESGQFLVEGLKLVTDALAEGWTVRSVVLEAGTLDQPAIAKAAATARIAGADILSVNHDILSKVTRRDNPQTILGVIDQRITHESSIAATATGVVVALHRVRDPGNLGTIIRTADAVGAGGVIIVGPSVDPFSLEAVRATMGSLFHVPVARMDEGQFLSFCRKWPGSIVGAHLKSSLDYRTARYERPALLVMGNEQAGLSEEISNACNFLVRIPIVGDADSLNLAVATGVMLYEIERDSLTRSGEAGGD
ncbi:MAG: TrmH family RNA methyltransferase [Alphaproteobacteria bacterium]